MFNVWAFFAIKFFLQGGSREAQEQDVPCPWGSGGPSPQQTAGNRKGTGGGHIRPEPAFASRVSGKGQQVLGKYVKKMQKKCIKFILTTVV